MEIRRAKTKRKHTNKQEDKIHYKNSHLNYHHNRTECVRERERKEAIARNMRVKCGVKCEKGGGLCLKARAHAKTI